MKFAYYPGCSLHSTGREYDISTQALCQKLGIELEEIPDWNCCGATSAHATDFFISLALPARDLLSAQKMGMDIIAPCAACYNRLKVTRSVLLENSQLNQRIGEALGSIYEGKTDVKCLIEVILGEIPYDYIVQNLQKPLNGLKIANYYGCLLVRPAKVTKFDDPENPQSLDRLMSIIGGQSVKWHYKTECCGASLALSKAEVVRERVYLILSNAKEAGAECVVTTCPLCHANLDTRQSEVEGKYGVEFDLPIFYFTQLLGLALGIHPNQMGLSRHLVSPFPLLREKGLVIG